MDKITEEQVLKVLDTCYSKVIEGLPGSKNCYKLADEYINKYTSSEKALQKFIDTQIAKCTTSGFITSLGGLITLPVAIPANLASVWYIQLKMIATIAVIGGHDPKDDEVQTLAYICLVGGSISQIFKQAGINFSNKLALKSIEKIPGRILTKINQKIGFRFVTKFGTRGIVNLWKLVPVAGGVIGGGIDFIETRKIAKKAYKTFVLEEIE